MLLGSEMPGGLFRKQEAIAMRCAEVCVRGSPGFGELNGLHSKPCKPLEPSRSPLRPAEW